MRDAGGQTGRQATALEVGHLAAISAQSKTYENQPPELRPFIFEVCEWTKLGGPLNAVPQGRTAARVSRP